MNSSVVEKPPRRRRRKKTKALRRRHRQRRDKRPVDFTTWMFAVAARAAKEEADWARDYFWQQGLVETKSWGTATLLQHPSLWQAALNIADYHFRPRGRDPDGFQDFPLARDLDYDDVVGIPFPLAVNAAQHDPVLRLGQRDGWPGLGFIPFSQ